MYYDEIASITGLPLSMVERIAEEHCMDDGEAYFAPFQRFIEESKNHREYSEENAVRDRELISDSPSPSYKSTSGNYEDAMDSRRHTRTVRTCNRMGR